MDSLGPSADFPAFNKPVVNDVGLGAGDFVIGLFCVSFPRIGLDERLLIVIEKMVPAGKVGCVRWRFKHRAGVWHGCSTVLRTIHLAVGIQEERKVRISDRIIKEFEMQEIDFGMKLESDDAAKLIDQTRLPPSEARSEMFDVFFDFRIHGYS